MSDDEEEYRYSDLEVESSDDTDKEQRRKRGLNTPGATRNELESFRVLDVQCIREQQHRIVKDVDELLNLGFNVTLRVLIEYRWNKEPLLEEYLKHGLDLVMRKAGVSRREGPATITSHCAICFDSLTANNSLINDFCNHCFCKECWCQHLLVRIREGSSQSRRIPCMQHKCDCAISQSLVEVALEGHLEEFRQYDQALVESFIEDNPRVKWCPSVPCCGRAIEIADSTSFRTDCECLCEEVFCFSCYEPSHTPVPCEWSKFWKAKCDREGANVSFISTHCKPCPTCKKTIIKHEGCNHVRCVCGQSMCWLCGAATGIKHDWNSIEGHKCDTYRPLSSSSAALQKQETDIYMFYFGRFETHMQSLHKAKELQLAVRKTAEALQSGCNSNSYLNDGDWLVIGLKQLFRMRQFIAWTYVFAFYAFYDENGTKIKIAESKMTNAGTCFYQTIFEDLQAQLQSSIESLSKLVELNASNMDDATKTDVLRLTTSSNQLAVNMWIFVRDEVLGNGLQLYYTPNIYSPIRTLAAGLGAKGVLDCSEYVVGTRSFQFQESLEEPDFSIHGIIQPKKTRCEESR